MLCINIYFSQQNIQLIHNIQSQLASFLDFQFLDQPDNTWQNIGKLHFGLVLNFVGALKLYFEASVVQNTKSLTFNHQVKTGRSLTLGIYSRAQADLPTPIA